MSAWNYWHVYHYMVTHYASTGLVPDKATLLNEFAELGSSEIDEGIAEFDLVIGNHREGVDQDACKEA
ncbi:hypothetical protein [Paenibacillus sp. NPDC058177]|uniref:hypothetical protein n=1 Tax=Paenibacillus sp. NPDC058177 TaxID=3346369 RepID=UPI0036DCF646